MTLQVRHVSTRLLLILALATALLAGIVAVGWATAHSGASHAVITTVPGGDGGGGRAMTASFGGPHGPPCGSGSGEC
jgi:hypothetical protein